MLEKTVPRGLKPPALLHIAIRDCLRTSAAERSCRLASSLLRDLVHKAVPPVQKLPRGAQAAVGHITAAETVLGVEERRAVSEAAESESSIPTRRRAQFCVVNFYHLVDISQPHAVLRQHREWMQDRNIFGRIYITHQGINAQLSGPREEAQAYAEWVAEQPPFKGLKWASDPADGHQYPRLRLKYRDNLVQLAGGTQALPITDRKERAKALSPAAWQRMLQTAVPQAHRAANAQLSEAPIVLDVRNSYEWDAGHFPGAQRPVEDHFHQTPTEDLPKHLERAARDRPVMMYCTGGIRCDVYSTYLRKKGFHNLYSLEGGVAKYLRELGTGAWQGSLFTFDDRLAVFPDGKHLIGANLTAAASCRCGASASLPHLNCANLDCNRLFLACSACQDMLRGCCCESCMEAPRYLRPPKSAGRYGSWHSMASSEELQQLRKAISSGRSGRRQAKRAKRLERLKAKHAEAREQKARRRELVKVALAHDKDSTSDGDWEALEVSEMQAAA